MAAESWQEAVAQQAEEAAARVRDVLSGGLGLLRAELGLELGLHPQSLPTWLALVVPAALGLGLLGLLLAVACGGGLRRKPARSAAERKSNEAAGAGLTAGGGQGKAVGPGPGQLHLKGDEQRKRNKKKLSEKTARVSGAAGAARAAPLRRKDAVGCGRRLGPAGGRVRAPAREGHERLLDSDRMRTTAAAFVVAPAGRGGSLAGRRGGSRVWRAAPSAGCTSPQALSPVPAAL